MEASAATPRVRPQIGDTLELTIDSLAYGGAGVARHEGYVLFVYGAVTGDRVRAVVTKRRRAYGEARVEELLAPGPDRIDPVADHPGVPWQVLRYEAQLAAKEAQVGDALRRIGGLEGFDLEPIVPAVEQWRYRNKLEYSFGTGPDGELVCGFHAAGRWDVVEPMDDCLWHRSAATTPGAEWSSGAGLRACRARPASGDRDAAQPGRARGPPHRRAAGAPRDDAG